MNRKRGYLYILLAAMIYSTTEVALKGLGGVFAPMQITVERVLIGALFLLPFALCSLRQNAIRLTRSDWGYFALLGFLTVTLHMSLLQMAVLHMDASATSIIYSGNPVFALAAAHLILHEPLKRNHLIAIGVELIGILFILNPAKLEVSPRGFAEILTATVLFAMYGTLCKLRIPRLGGLVITTFNMVLGGLELLALLLLGHIPAVGALYRSLGLDIFADVPFFAGFTLRSALLLCYVGIFCAAIGFLLIVCWTLFLLFHTRGIIRFSSAPQDGHFGREPEDRLPIDAFASRYGFTDRERDVLEYLSAGYSIQKISEQLFISPNTVKSHVASIFRKTDTHTKQGIIDLVHAASTDGRRRGDSSDR